MLDVCSDINIPTINNRYAYKLQRQSIFYTSKYEALLDFKKTTNRIAFPYYHGDPRTHKEFKKHIDTINLHHKDIHKIQVSHSYTEDLILNTGIDAQKVNRIPISIDINKFDFTNDKKKSSIRNRLNIPDSTFLIGSFQKDGIGWGEGNEPKLIKGPDIFLDVIKALKDSHKDIMVLLTGPARGYVKRGLKKIDVKYCHYNLKNYSKISDFYQALDLYLIASREEGGPRAVLESMASGVPLVTTRVGQAMDLVKHKENGWIVDVGDTDGLVECSREAIENGYKLDTLLYNARKTAENNSYNQQIPLWVNFMKGFVEN